LRSIESHTRMIVIEGEYAFVLVITMAAYPGIAGTEVAVFHVGWNRRTLRKSAVESFTVPRPILTVRGDDHPLLTQRMPTLFPFHWFRHPNVSSIESPSRNAQVVLE